MSTVSIGKRTRTVTVQAAGVRLVVVPQQPMAIMLGGALDDVTTDHRSAQLRAGASYFWLTTAGSRRCSMISLDPAAPDDPLPSNDPQARLLDVTEA